MAGNSEVISEAVATIGAQERTAAGYRLSKMAYLADCQRHWSLIGSTYDINPTDQAHYDQIVRIRPPKRDFVWQTEVAMGGAKQLLRRNEAALFIPRLTPFKAALPEDVLLGEFDPADGYFDVVASFDDSGYGDDLTDAFKQLIKPPSLEADWAEEHCIEAAREGWRVLTEVAANPGDDMALAARTERLLDIFQFSDEVALAR